MKKWLALVCLIVLGIALCFKALPLSAEKSFADIGRFATDEEILGCWKMVPMPERVAKNFNKTNPWPQPYQWFAFHEDGQAFSMMATRDMEEITAV